MVLIIMFDHRSKSTGSFKSNIIMVSIKFMLNMVCLFFLLHLITHQPCSGPQSTCCQELDGVGQVFSRSPQLVGG